jgi:hypothetical protein
MILFDREDVLRMNMEEKTAALLIKEKVIKHVNGAGQSVQTHNGRDTPFTQSI